MDVLTGLITCSKVEFFAITNCIDNVWDETLWIFTCSIDCRNIEMPVSEVVLIRSNELTQHAFADGIVVRSSTHWGKNVFLCEEALFFSFSHFEYATEGNKSTLVVEFFQLVADSDRSSYIEVINEVEAFLEVCLNTCTNGINDYIRIHETRTIELCIHEVHFIEIVILVTNRFIKSVHIQSPSGFVGIFSNGCWEEAICS